MNVRVFPTGQFVFNVPKDDVRFAMQQAAFEGWDLAGIAGSQVSVCKIDPVKLKSEIILDNGDVLDLYND